MLQTARDVDIVEGFYNEQVAKINKQNEEIVTLSKRAIQIQLQKDKCKAIVEKMQHTLGKISMLQNYTIFNQEQLRKLALLHDVYRNTYHSAKWFKEKMDQTTFDDNNQYQNLQTVIVKAYADLFKVSEKKLLAILMESRHLKNTIRLKLEHLLQVLSLLAQVLFY
ncbi:EXS_family protein [Hexamita inflata]|uniref:EXS family protein n=1 Tax=Hexamita inflata TaxID=28002 RepID=A0AA86Q994_9EUKA|nr:EXS family protein [Hexamita inflata]